MTRPDRPPGPEFFERSRPALGAASAAIGLGPVRIVLDGLAPDVVETLHRRYGPYITPARREESRALVVDVVRGEQDYFIRPSDGRENVRVLIACDGARVRYLSYRVAGWFDTADGRGGIVLGSGELEPLHRALENYIRAAVAWQAASLGGALVHAASAVWKGAGYLFYGESGAGKSTLAACNRRARIVSDDLTLVVPGEAGGLDIVGSPFRGTYEGGAPVVGRYPLRAGFRLVQDERAAVRRVPRVVALAELVGNLPFVAEAYARRPDLLDALSANLEPLPLAHLHFRKDDDYWDAIEAAGL